MGRFGHKAVDHCIRSGRHIVAEDRTFDWDHMLVHELLEVLRSWRLGFSVSLA